MKGTTSHRRWVAIAASITLVGLAGAVYSVVSSRPHLTGSYEEVPGATIVGDSQLTDRTLSLTISTPSFSENTRAEVMLPTGYALDSDKRWPVTYYLAGTGHNEQRFRASYEGEEATAAFDSIVVIPKGDVSYWSDAYAAGGGKYETFLTTQLIPLIDANFRTIDDRAHRAVFGESMGGYGTMMIAARHPDLFVAAASLSGVLDSNYDRGAALISLAGAPNSVYGPRDSELIRWVGHNPTDLAANLRGLNLQIRVGNGVLGNGEGGTDSMGCDPEKTIVGRESRTMSDTLTELAIPHVWHEYSFGCHSDPLIRREIRDALAGITAAFGTAPPTSFDYRSIEHDFSVYGWTVSADPRRPLEFLALSGVDAKGFTIEGSGETTVTTAPTFTAGQAVDIVVGGVTTSAVADALGRIEFRVDLGEPNAEQQFTPGSTTTVTTARVQLIAR